MLPKKIVNQIILWAPVVIWAGLIFKVSDGSVPKVGDSYWVDFAAKKFAHMFVYAAFALLNYRALVGEKIDRKKAALYSILISFLYGATDEFHQSYTPGREPRIRDVIFDTIGSSVAVFIVYNYWDKFKKYILK